MYALQEKYSHWFSIGHVPDTYYNPVDLRRPAIRDEPTDMLVDDASNNADAFENDFDEFQDSVNEFDQPVDDFEYEDLFGEFEQHVNGFADPGAVFDDPMGE